MKSVFSEEICPVTGCLNVDVLWLWLHAKRRRVEKRERGEKRKSNALLIMFSLAFPTRTVDSIAIRGTFYRNTLSLMTFPEECSMCDTNEAWPGPLILFNAKCGAKHKPLQKLYWFQLHGVIHFLTRALKHLAVIGCNTNGTVGFLMGEETCEITQVILLLSSAGLFISSSCGVIGWNWACWVLVIGWLRKHPGDIMWGKCLTAHHLSSFSLCLKRLKSCQVSVDSKSIQ